MANEINLNVSLSASKNGAAVSGSKSKSANLTGNNQASWTQIIGTSAEQIGVPSDLTDMQYIEIINLDTSNYVNLGLEATVITQNFAKLNPGDPCFIPPASGSMAIYAKANSAPVTVQITIVGS